MEVEVVRPNVAVYSALTLHSWEEAVSSLFSKTSAALVAPPSGPAPHAPLSFSLHLAVQV